MASDGLRKFHPQTMSATVTARLEPFILVREKIVFAQRNTPFESVLC